MLKIVDIWMMRRRTIKSETEEAKPVENVECHMYVNKSFLEVVKSSIEVKNLSNETNKLSKKKKKIIRSIEDRMDELFQMATVYTDVTLDNTVVLAIAYLNLGLIYAMCSEKEELHTGKDHFMRCIELLKGKELEDIAILTAIRALNELKFVLIKLEESEDSLLDRAVDLYLKYTKENKYPDPINVLSTLGIEDTDVQLSLDQLHYLTIDNLIKQYYLWPKNKDRLVTYLHDLLNRELFETLENLEVECYYWTLASIDLSEYFVCKRRFTEARHHLAAAEYVMHRFYTDKLMTLDETIYSKATRDFMFNKYEHAYANIARLWGNYGIKLLCLSKEKLCGENDESCETDNSNSESLTNPEMKLKNFLFADLEKDLESITSQVTDTYVSNLNDAKALFVFILKWLNKAKSYFFEKDLVQYAKIILNIAKAYKYLVYFEQSIDNRTKLCKLRIEILEKISKELNPIAKSKPEREICQHIHIQLGIAYSVFSHMKAEKLHDDVLVTTAEYDCMNEEITKSVTNATKYFNIYLNST